MIKPEDVKHLPDDENTPEKRAEKIWAFFGKKEDGEFLCLYYLWFYSLWFLETPAGFSSLSHRVQAELWDTSCPHFVLAIFKGWEKGLAMCISKG